MTGTITSENIELFFWITLYEEPEIKKKSVNIRKSKVARAYFKVRKYERLQQNNIYNRRRMKEVMKAWSMLEGTEWDVQILAISGRKNKVLDRNWSEIIFLLVKGRSGL